MHRILLWLPLIAGVLWGSDVTGKWSGTVEVTDPASGDRIETAVRAELRQSGSAVTIRIGRAADAEASAEGRGRLDGNILTLTVTSPEGEKPFRFRLVLTGSDRLEGDMEGAIDTGKIAGKVRLTRPAAP
jgi:hypothetical protein